MGKNSCPATKPFGNIVCVLPQSQTPKNPGLAKVKNTIPILSINFAGDS